MTRRRSSKSSTLHHSANTIACIFIAAVIVLLIVIAWNSCHSRNTLSGKNTPQNATSELLKVTLPTQLDQQIIDYPGFTVSFNPTHHQPNYSAWVIDVNNLDGPVPRAKKFTADPDIPGSATPDDYRNSGYDRGHMAPSGDMKWNQESMDACFMMTNISPQNHALNTRAWKNLENKCRAWARRDSVLVVVCGPVLTDNLTRTIGNNAVTVPDRFFKVILAPYANPPRAIGFIMPNANVAGGIQPAAVSVDQVEAVTGMDFFAALPDDVENRVESQADFLLWEKSARR